MQTLAFRPLGHDQLPAMFAGLELALEVEPAQTGATCLAFSVSLQNTSRAAVSLYNPYDVLTYQLVADGVGPIELSSPPSRLAAGHFVDRSGYLRVQSMRIGGVVVADVEAQLASLELTIEPGTTVLYDLVIDHVAPPPGEVGPTPIGPGPYTLRCRTSLIPMSSADPISVVMAAGDVHLIVT